MRYVRAVTRRGRIEEARLDWDAGAPRSAAFGDVYFSGDGIEEAAHVFLRGNDLPRRFSFAPRFTIGELGFGTGLNILLAWNAWRRAGKPPGAKLRLFSIEAAPLACADLERAHRAWPELMARADRLRALYPPPAHGFHRLHLDENVTLTLYYGDAAAGLHAMEGGVDAWFLDGFAPSKNPDMWSSEITGELARLSKAGATFATFTVAGAVRRAFGETGFSIEKRPGFGRKREMLVGRLDHPSAETSRRAPWFDTRPCAKLSPGASIAVIGAGIAGASLAFELTRAGFGVTVYDVDNPASGASGNPAGLFMPRVDLGDTPAARFHLAAYLYALGLLEELGDEPTFNPCGVVLGAPDEKEKLRQRKILGAGLLPDGWIEETDGGLFFPKAGVIAPPRIVRALLGDATFVKARVRSIDRDGACPIIQTDDGNRVAYDAVVLANGLEALRFAQARALPLAGSAGQVDWFPDAKAPERALAFGAYAAPAPDGGLVIGATHAPAPDGAASEPSREATQANINALARFAPPIAAGLDPNGSRPRTGVRSTTPDRLPIVGPLPDWSFYGGAYDGLRTGRKGDYPPGESQPGLFILNGLGSRGFVTAPLAAAMIAAEMAGEPAPVEYKIAEALHPARFFIRNLRRGRLRQKA
ncbi:MAG: bifunctional tRNA (5-methylaminomethyl-2-thiouridine)(34)-methyltransferase MnmD/FAD-dependent 5-carboxymethylaminomethyl-2-thiouridine(34) oxidoreductase MnmC [Parvularculaceae bacterium]